MHASMKLVDNVEHSQQTLYTKGFALVYCVFHKGKETNDELQSKCKESICSLSDERVNA